VEEEEQGVQAAGQQGRRFALEQGPGQGVERQQRHEDKRRGQIVQHQHDRVYAGDPGQGGLLQEPTVDLGARHLGHVAEVRFAQG
jgi:hypothetical protein